MKERELVTIKQDFLDMFMVCKTTRNSDTKVRDHIFTVKLNVIYVIGENNISVNEMQNNTLMGGPMGPMHNSDQVILR